jgi:hypothetical protein
MKTRFQRTFFFCFIGLVCSPLLIYWLTITLAKNAVEALAPIVVLIHMAFFVYFFPVLITLGRGSFKVGNLLSIDLGGIGSLAKTVIFYTAVSVVIGYALVWREGKNKKVT